MTWETRDVLLIVGAVVSAAATIITVRHHMAALTKDFERTTAELKQQITSLQESRDKLGERIGRLERWRAIKLAVAKRLATPPVGTSVPRGVKDGNDSGETEG